MSKHKNNPKLTGPWRNIHGAVWLIGLAVIALNGWWWPGILVLVAISAILESVIMMVVPGAVESEAKEDAAAAFGNTAFPGVQTPAAPARRADLLPTNCPRCGAPTRGHEVTWTGERSADCPFCGANLPMKPV
jgi:hypothetical protein